eukprot:5604177-Amphidinium_carterae.1
MTAHPLYLNVANGGLDAVFHSGVSSARLSQPKLKLVGYYSSPFAISHDDSLSLQSFTGDHDGMQFRFVNGLPTTRQR